LRVEKLSVRAGEPPTIRDAMKHPGPYQKIVMDRRPFMPINTESRMVRQLDDELGKDEKYQEYQKYQDYQREGKKRRKYKPGGDWRKPPRGFQTPFSSASRDK